MLLEHIRVMELSSEYGNCMHVRQSWLNVFFVVIAFKSFTLFIGLKHWLGVVGCGEGVVYLTSTGRLIDIGL